MMFGRESRTGAQEVHAVRFGDGDRRTGHGQRWEMSISVMGVSRGVGFRSVSPQLHPPDHEHGTHLVC